MDKKTKKRLEQNGWTIGSAAEFAGLTPADEKLIEQRRRLAAKPARPEVVEAIQRVRKRFRKTLDRLAK